MGLLELFILSASLSFDTFAVCLSGGMELHEVKLSKKATIAAFFAVIQTLFLFLGWLLGGTFVDRIAAYGFWIAFVILAFLGGKMIVEAIWGDDEVDSNPCLMVNTKLFALSVATSIDALAVGVSLALIHISIYKMFFAALMTLLVTGIASGAGLYGGKKLKGHSSLKVEVLGGVILIAIGIRILVENLFF